MINKLKRAPKFTRYKRATKKTSPKGRIDWEEAPDIKKRVNHIVTTAEFSWIIPTGIHCFRSRGSTSNAVARIWGLSRLWQIALKEEPAYALEVISERFDKLRAKQQDRVLVHELAHVPKNFSGALLPHRRKGKGNFHDRLETMVAAYERKR